METGGGANMEKIDLTLSLGRSTKSKDESKSTTNGNINSLLGSCSYVAIPPRNDMMGLCISGYGNMSNPFAGSSTPRLNTNGNKVCRVCGATTTPLWRKGPDGRQTLCNACGLKHLRLAKKNTSKP